MATMVYAAICTVAFELIYVATGDELHDSEIDPVHVEVLVPAFAIGALVHHVHPGHEQSAVSPIDARPSVDPIRPTIPHGSTGNELPEKSEEKSKEKSEEKSEEEMMEEKVSFIVSAIFMVFVGLSMPSFVVDTSDYSCGGGSGSGDGLAAVSGSNETSGSEDAGMKMLPVGTLILHVVVVQVLMLLGKMVPALCYRDEVPLKTRFALCLGMTARGEVGAAHLLMSLALGIRGPGPKIAVLSLAINLLLSGAIIGGVAKMMKKTAPPAQGAISAA